MMDTARRTESVFSATAALYDQDRARLIPGYAEFYAAAVALLPDGTDHVLDLGAGTGLLSAWVRERFPDAHLHLIDNSAAMLARARARFAQDQEAALQLGDYTACAWGGSYDAVVSALSIHHLPDAAKRALFARVHAALKLGGVFINAEQVLQSDEAAEQAARGEWLADVRALGATEEQIAASLLRQSEDRCATADAQLGWMTDAGMVHAACRWHRGRFAVLTARRAAPAATVPAE